MKIQLKKSKEEYKQNQANQKRINSQPIEFPINKHSRQSKSRTHNGKGYTYECQEAVAVNQTDKRSNYRKLVQSRCLSAKQ